LKNPASAFVVTFETVFLKSAVFTCIDQHNGSRIFGVSSHMPAYQGHIDPQGEDMQLQ